MKIIRILHLGVFIYIIPNRSTTIERVVDSIVSDEHF